MLKSVLRTGQLKNVLRAGRCDKCFEGWTVLKTVLRAGQCEG